MLVDGLKSLEVVAASTLAIASGLSTAAMFLPRPLVNLKVLNLLFVFTAMGLLAHQNLAFIILLFRYWGLMG